MGLEVGHMADAVLNPSAGGGPPRVNGFVVAVQRRRVFVGIGRVAEIEVDGVRLRRGAVNMRQFELRPGEQLVVGELFRQRLDGQTITDAGITPAPEPYSWEVATIALAGGGIPRAVRRKSSTGARHASCSRASRRRPGRPRRSNSSIRSRWRGRYASCLCPAPRACLGARGRPPRGSARGTLRGRAGTDRGGPRPREGGASPRRDGGRRRRRPARRVLRHPARASC